MTEGSSNSNSDLKQLILDQSDHLIKLQINYNNLQLKFVDEKEKNGEEKKILQEKNLSLENEFTNFKKEMNEFFVHISNKWKEIKYKCCINKCINTDNPIGNCIEGNGYINLIDDENIKYINCEEGKGI
uniref:Uncharacterized protein n=1 Tax=Meloidogyne hapla TaxID=6305 RepID=A0A1I8BER1_MELHA